MSRSATQAMTMIKGAWLKEPSLAAVLELLNQSGVTRIAGGAVRNALMGLPVGEVDLATTLEPKAVIQLAENARFSVHTPGIEHGTVMIVAGERPFEVTTLRRDVETYGRKAKVEFTDDWVADAMRRDFTINALYCDRDGKVFDPLGNFNDVKRKIVRFIGSPEERIGEDHLRILRFFRFTAQLAPGRPHAKSLASCVKLRRLLLSLSAERIRQELWKLLVADRGPAMIELMARKRIAQVILGRRVDTKILKRMAQCDTTAKLEHDPLLRIEALSGNAMAFREHLKLTNGEIRRLECMRKAVAPLPQLRPAERRAVIYHLGRETFLDTVRISWARSRASPKDKGWKSLADFARKAQLPTFPVSGKDLLNLGLAPGPEVGRVLKILEDWWIAEGFRGEKDTVLDHAMRKGLVLPKTAGVAPIQD